MRIYSARADSPRGWSDSRMSGLAYEVPKRQIMMEAVILKRRV
jgi:hypothetical protein